MLHFSSVEVTEWSDDALALTLALKAFQLHSRSREAFELAEEVQELTAEQARRAQAAPLKKEEH